MKANPYAAQAKPLNKEMSETESSCLLVLDLSFVHPSLLSLSYLRLSLLACKCTLIV